MAARRTVHRVAGGGGLLLHVEETGPHDGHPILFIHGFAACGEVWWRQLDSDLADEFRLVTMDGRGHGQSEKPEGVYSDSARWGDDIHAVICTLGLEQPVLVGWSYGGLLIGDYLAHHGEEGISGINLVAGISRIGTKPANTLLGRKFKHLIPALYAPGVDENLAALTALVRLHYHREPSAADFYADVGYGAVVPLHVRRGMFDRTIEHTGLLERISVPILLTHGKQDETVLLAASQEHAERIPTAKASFWSDAGHMPFAEDPARFNRELRAFVAALKRR